MQLALIQDISIPCIATHASACNSSNAYFTYNVNLQQRCSLSLPLLERFCLRDTCHCMLRHYDYGSNKVLPHTVQNSSDASSLKGASGTADKVSFQ